MLGRVAADPTVERIRPPATRAVTLLRGTIIGTV
jgi:hypothetical protein